MNVKDIIKRYDALNTNKMNWEEHWDDVLNYVVPRKADIWTPRDTASGEKKDQRVVDASAVDSCEKLAAQLHSMLTNPATRWFSLTTLNPMLDRMDEVRLFFQRCEDVMYKVYEVSNFYTELHEYYLDQGSIGTAPFIVMEDDETIARFHSRPIYEMEVDESSKGVIDTVIRKIRWTARQIINEFGKEKVPTELMDEFVANGNRRYDVLHAVYPVSDEFDSGKRKSMEARGFKFISKYILKDHQLILSESGFRTSPYIIARWTKQSGEVFGRGPGMKALPDIKMLNAIMKTTIRAAQKITDPPLLVPDDNFYGPPNIMPGGINYYRPGSRDRIETLEIKARPDFGVQFLDRLEAKIKDHFYINQLMLTREPQMTATEVMQRTEENLRMMGPILARQHFEFLGPLTERVFDICLRRNLFPEAPEVLRDANMSARYTSMIAKAQKSTQAEVLNRALGSMAPLIQLNPNVVDNFDTDEAFNYIFDLYGLPQDIKRSAKDVEDLRSQRAEAEEAQQQMMQEQHEANTIAKVGPTAVQSQSQTE